MLKRVTIIRKVSLLFLIVLLVGGSIIAYLFLTKQSRYDKKTERFLNHPANFIENYPANFKSSGIVERIQPATPAMIELISLDNELSDFSEVPRAAVISESFMKDIRQAILEMPEAFQRRVSEKCVGIYLVENLGSTAITEFVRNSEGKIEFTSVTLDVKAVDRPANEWATWKENTPFKRDNSQKVLSATIEDPENNNRKNAIQYILLHEFAHVISVGLNEIPLKQKNYSYDDLQEGQRFFYQSWIIGSDRQPLLRTEYRLVRPVRYYAEKEAEKKPIDEAMEAYNSLAMSNFPTLYATTNPDDDFAESLASYIHNVIMKKPWKVELSGFFADDKPAVFQLCWHEERCLEKQKKIEAIYQSLQ